MAQAAKLPPPKAPALRRAPALASWTVTFRYKDEDSKAQAPAGKPALNDRVRTITVTKSGKTYWEQGVMISGKKYEKWVLDGAQLKTMPGGNEMAMIPKPDEEHPQPDYSDYSRCDFPELDWVSLENYREATTYEDKPAYFFEAGESGDRGGRVLLSEAQLPFSFSNRESVRTYVFNPAPAAPLVLPEKIAKILQTHKRGLEALQMRASPP